MPLALQRFEVLKTGFAMSIVAPKGRQPLAADALFGLVRTGVANLPAHRVGGADIAFTDALLSAFARGSRTSPARLAFDHERAAGHVDTSDGLARVPCDTPRRELLAPVSPASLRPLFQSVFRQLQRGKALAPLVCFEGGSLLALEGTGYVASTTLHGASGRPKVHRHGRVTSAQQMLGAAMVHPDVRAVMPLMPEALVQHDGTAKHACERHAAQRFMAKWRQDHPHLKGIITEDRRSAHAPPLETLQAHPRHDLLGVKDGDHALLFHPVQGAAHAGRVTSDARPDRVAGVVHRCRLVHDVPLHASPADVRTNVLEAWAMGDTKGHPCSGVTD